MTGVSPWQNGIVSNSTPEKADDRYFSASALKTLSLWDAVTTAGMKAATIYWPVTLGANDAVNFPEYWESRKGNAIAFETIADKSTPPGEVDRIEKAFPSFQKQLWDDSSSANAATSLLA